MYCSKCGKQINDESKFCQFCGAQTGSTLPKFLQMDQIKAALTPPPIQEHSTNYTQQENYQQNYNQQNYNQQNYNQQNYNQQSYNQQNFYQQNQQAYSQQTIYQAYPAPATPQQLPMNWFKFVIWVQLFLGAFINVIAGFMHITGLRYGKTRYFVYQWTSGLQFLDIVFGIGYFAFAAIAIFVRQQLVHYKKNSPMMLIGSYFLQIPFSIVYALAYTIVLEANCFDASIIGMIGGTAILCALSYIYFEKRKAYFNQ